MLHLSHVHFLILLKGNAAFLYYLHIGVVSDMYTEILETLELDSRNRIRFSLVSLMEQYPYSEIVVSAICQKAKVSRQTYYRLFSSKDDVLTLHLNEVMKEYLLPKILLDNASTNEFLQFFLFFAGYKDLLKILYRNDKMYLLQHVLTRYSKLFIQEPFYRVAIGYNYAVDFVASTLCSLLTVWTQMEFKTGCSTLASFASSFLEAVN